MISIALQFGLFTIFGLAVNSGTPLAIGGLMDVTRVGGASIWIYNISTLVVNGGLNYYWMGVTARYSNM